MSFMLAAVIRLTDANRQAHTRMYKNEMLDRVEVRVCQALECSLADILEFPA